MQRKIMFLDVETTGLDEKDDDGYTLLAHEIHSIIELSYIVDIDGKMVKRNTLYASPWSNDTIDREALAINGIDIDKLDSYGTQKEMYSSFKEDLSKYVDPYNKQDKMFFVAYNARYDWDFTRQLFMRHEDEYFGSWFWFPYIDMMQVIGGMLMMENVRHLLPDMRLPTLSKHLIGPEVEEHNFHSSLYDCRMVRQMLYTFIDDSK